nr:hypothetical protein [Sedimenticola hydrogenitrophicus]
MGLARRCDQFIQPFQPLLPLPQTRFVVDVAVVAEELDAGAQAFGEQPAPLQGGEVSLPCRVTERETDVP